MSIEQLIAQVRVEELRKEAAIERQVAIARRARRCRQQAKPSRLRSLFSWGPQLAVRCDPEAAQ